MENIKSEIRSIYKGCANTREDTNTIEKELLEIIHICFGKNCPEIDRHSIPRKRSYKFSSNIDKFILRCPDISIKAIKDIVQAEKKQRQAFLAKQFPAMTVTELFNLVKPLIGEAPTPEEMALLRASLVAATIAAFVRDDEKFQIFVFYERIKNIAETVKPANKQQTKNKILANIDKLFGIFANEEENQESEEKSEGKNDEA